MGISSFVIGQRSKARRLQQPQRIDHLNRRERRLGPFVAGFAAGSVEGLVEVFAGEDSEEDRDAGLLGGPHQAGGDLVVDVVVVSRLPLDDGSEGDDGGELLAAREVLCELRKLERARSPDDGELLVFGSVAAEGVECSVKQPARDEVVESRHDDREMVAGVADEEVGFDGGGHGG